MKKPIVCLAIVAAVIVVAAPLRDARAQAEPEKRPGPAPQAAPKEVPPPPPPSGPLGAPETVDQLQLKTGVDSTMARMDMLMRESQALSKSFASLATLHHGADRSEILVMQRVSDAMGSMAAELKDTLVQYKKMLDDETDTESGAMKAEVDGLHAAMQVIAGEVSDAIMTLHRLEAQLGQG